MAKTLIAFFSRADENYFGGAMRYVKVGNTEIVVNQMKEMIDADTFKIEMKEPYSPVYMTCIDEAKKDLREGARPELVNFPESIDQYDTIILAYPNYWGTYPMAVATFLDRCDFAGKTILRPVATGTNPPGVDAIAISAEGAYPANNCYAISQPPHGHEIRFINSLGVHENIFVAGLPTRVVNITTDQYTIARQETLTKFSRAIAVKYGDRETWTFSSGPLDEEWVSWYIHEFLMASWVWIDINNMWIPCQVLPEEQVTLVQHDKTDMLEVMLALKLDINGSPL